MFQFRNHLKQMWKQLPQKRTKLFEKQRQAFSRVDRALNGLRYPLHMYLIGANISIFGLYHSGIISPNNFYKHFTFSRESLRQGRFHTIITYSFAHTQFFHLLTNMMGLYFFGSFLENVYGRKALGKLYFGGALMGAAFILAESNKKRFNVVNLGASASVYSILTNFTLNFPKYIIYLYFIPMPAWVVGAGIMMYTTFYIGSNDGISHAGHLGGITFGAISYFLLRRGMF